MAPSNTYERERRNAVRMDRDPRVNVARMQLGYEQWMREEAINLLVSLAREGLVGPVCPPAPKKKTHAVKRGGRMEPRKLKF